MKKYLAILLILSIALSVDDIWLGLLLLYEGLVLAAAIKLIKLWRVVK